MQHKQAPFVQTVAAKSRVQSLLHFSAKDSTIIDMDEKELSSPETEEPSADSVQPELNALNETDADEAGLPLFDDPTDQATEPDETAYSDSPESAVDSTSSEEPEAEPEALSLSVDDAATEDDPERVLESAVVDDLNYDGAPDFDNADFDIDAALAAVAGLPALADLPETPEDEAAESYSDEQPNDAEADEAAIPQPAAYQDAQVSPPPLSKLRRGQAASVVPALLLIAVGAGLSLYLTTNDEAINPAIILSVLLALGGMVLLSWWLSSHRSASGAFFFGSLLLFNAAAIFISNTPQGFDLAGWPLSIAATGLAIFLTALVVPHMGGRLAVVGLGIIIAAVAGVALTSNLIDPSIQEIAANVWPLAPALILFFLIAPLFRRNRRS